MHKMFEISFQRGTSSFGHMLSPLKRFRHQTGVNTSLGISHYLMLPLENDTIVGLKIFHSLQEG